MTFVPASAQFVLVVLTTCCINSPTNLFSPRPPIDRIRLARRGRELDLFGFSVEIDRDERNEGSNLFYGLEGGWETKEKHRR